MIKVGVIGSTGYAGTELVRILMQHPETEIITATSKSYIGQKFYDVYSNYREVTELICQPEDIETMAEQCDVIFMALPHGVAAKKVTKCILEKTKIIDFGADFRLKDGAVYEKWYGIEHTGKNLLPEAVYGLCERNREQIQGAKLLANPGCYTTCSILSLTPLVAEHLIDTKSIIVDAKSGVTGAGRSMDLGSLYCECNESTKAYKVASHRHTPEIEEQLSNAGKEEIVISFTPHLIPMNRGILATCYATVKEGVTEEQIRQAYEKQYGAEKFIRLLPKGKFPETKWVKGSNFVDIGFTLDQRTGRVLVIGAIDNLVKGAAGQAVQNMNIMFGLEETTGLWNVPVFPA